MLKDIKGREYYWEYVRKFDERPTALNTWEEMYYYIDFDWKYLYTLPYLVARETILQSLQYQILNRYFPCSAIVHKWYPKESPLCSHCKEEESLEHYFFDCQKLLPFWKAFKVCWFKSSHCNINVCAPDVVRLTGLIGFHLPLQSITVLSYLYQDFGNCQSILARDCGQTLVSIIHPTFAAYSLSSVWQQFSLGDRGQPNLSCQSSQPTLLNLNQCFGKHWLVLKRYHFFQSTGCSLAFMN